MATFFARYPSESGSLPIGSATAANQVLQLAQETAIAGSTASIDTKTPTVGQKAMAASSPVVIASDQSAIPVSGSVTVTGGATAANQVLEIADLDAINAKTPALGQALAAASSPVVLTAAQLATLAAPVVSGTVTANAGTNLNTSALNLETTQTAMSAKLPATLGQKAMAASMAVALASDQSAIPVTVSAGTAVIGKVSIDQTTPGTTNAVQANAGTNLNTSALNLETTQTAMSAKLPATLGQKAMSAALAVSIASDQSAVPVSTPDITATGNITIQNSVPAGTATAGSAVLTGALAGSNVLGVQVTGTYTGALSLQCTIDGTNWITIGGLVFTNVNTQAQSATITTATVGIFQCDVAGFNQARVTGLAAMTGTAVVTLRASLGQGLVSLDSPIPAGTAIIGALSANQSSNTAQINGVTPLMGNGVTGTGAQRVTVSSDNTPFPVKIDQTTPGTTNLVALSANISTNLAQVNGVATLAGSGSTGTGAQRINISTGATPTTANVAGSATTVTLLSASTSRLGAAFFNDSTSILYLKFGATASVTSYTVQMPPNYYYELPGPHIYNGIVDGIWASATGNCRVTSWA